MLELIREFGKRAFRFTTPSSLRSWRAANWRVWQGGKVVRHVILEECGFWRSLSENRPVDKAGRPLPWYTYPAIHFLDSLDVRDYSVLEWGAGNSSLYWGQRARSVVSVEHDEEWIARITPELTQLPVKLVTANESRQYVGLCSDLVGGSEFDIIVIDGLWRAACARAAVSRVKPTGIVLLDNSDWYPKTCSWLRGQGLMQIDFHGLAPSTWVTSTTSLFCRGQFSPRVTAADLPGRSIGSLFRQYDDHPEFGVPPGMSADDFADLQS